ncbi:hypothetical protein BOX15_Mlig000518g3, partial [Macrostomum lignano]
IAAVIKKSRMSATVTEKLVPESEVTRLVIECMRWAGADSTHAARLAEILLSADRRGHYSHGINRLDVYVRDVRAGVTQGSGEPAILKETAGTAHVDGRHLLGVVVGEFCMDLAVAKARQCGVGWVVAANSTHFGIAGHYSLRAAGHGLIGLAFTNASPILVPTRAKQPALGTNPVCMAAPTDRPGEPFLLDMATSAVAYGKVEMKHRTGQQLPAGWAVDSEGRETRDSEAGLHGGVLPLGGLEETSGYKGYGLALMVEILCSLLAGTPVGPSVRAWKSDTAPARLGQCFVAVDPSAFAPDFSGRLSEVADVFRGLEPADPDSPVLFPGDPERAREADCARRGGVAYHVNQLAHLAALAQECGVEPMRTVD